jgi:hypothetical protein
MRTSTKSDFTKGQVKWMYFQGFVLMDLIDPILKWIPKYLYFLKSSLNKLSKSENRFKKYGSCGKLWADNRKP